MEYSIDPFFSDVQKHRSSKVLSAFPDLIGSDVPLSLWPYLETGTERFYDRKSFAAYSQFLKEELHSAPHLLREVLTECETPFRDNLAVLADINRMSQNDDILPTHNPDIAELIDTVINPGYLKLIEGPFSTLLYPLALLSRKKRTASIEKLDVFNRVEEVRRSRTYSLLCAHYEHTIRNGIAHGGVVYHNSEVIYRDKKGGTSRHSYRSLVSLFDRLLDACNGMNLALSIFYFSNSNSTGLSIPRPLRLAEFRAQMQTDDFQVYAVLEERFHDRSQLNIYTRDSLYTFTQAYFYAFRSAIVAEGLFPHYDRYFVGLHSAHSKSSVGWAAFDGLQLGHFRRNPPPSIASFQSALEENLVFFIQKPQLLLWLFSGRIYWHTIKRMIPVIVRDFRLQWRGFDILIRHSKMHRNGFHSVLHAEIVIRTRTGNSTKQILHKFHNYIIRRVLQRARSEAPFSLRWLPVGYARISMFTVDLRKRDLLSSGLLSPLVAVIEFKRLSRIQSIPIVDSELFRPNRRTTICINRKHVA